MSYTQQLFNLPNNLLSLVRNLETTRKKICKAEWSTIFNNVCLQENLLPSYTHPCYVKVNLNSKNYTAKSFRSYTFQ